MSQTTAADLNNNLPTVANTAVRLPNVGDVMIDGPLAEARFPAYAVPNLAGYSSPGFVVAWQKIRDRYGVRTLFCEALGSFFFVFLLIMPAAAITLTGGVQGSFVVTILCLALAVTYAVFVGAPHSGAHLSPTITVMLCIFRGFPWRYAPLYIIAQWIGAFMAGVFSYALIAPWLAQLDGGIRNNVPALVAIFISTPNEFISIGHLIFIEILGDAIFIFIVFTLLDIRNPLVNPQSSPILIGFAVFLVAAAFGWYGYVLNPFRDFAVRVYLSHYYNGIFSYHHYYSMVALFCPFVGHFLGALAYDMMISSRYVEPVQAAQMEMQNASAHGGLKHPHPGQHHVAAPPSTGVYPNSSMDPVGGVAL